MKMKSFCFREVVHHMRVGVRSKNLYTECNKIVAPPPLDHSSSIIGHLFYVHLVQFLSEDL